MGRTLEAIFRNPLQLLALIVLLPILGVAVVYVVVPRTYQSSASLWALQRYFVIGATGPESDNLSTPAQTQATALTELLQTRSFVASVVAGINLAPTLSLSDSVLNDPQQLQDALFTEISKHVTVIPSAYNLFDITYINRNPVVAQQIVASVINNYGSQSLRLSITEGENLLAGYQTQLANAQKDLDDATRAEAQYLSAHPGLTANQLTSNPQYALLDARRVQAQTTVQTIQNTINTIQQSINTVGTNSNTLFRIIDAPQTPTHSLSRTKDYLVGGGIGLGVAFLTYILYLVIVVRRDNSIYSAHDLQGSVAFPIIMQLPRFTPATVSLLITNTPAEQALLTAGPPPTQ